MTLDDWKNMGLPEHGYHEFMRSKLITIVPRREFSIMAIKWDIITPMHDRQRPWDNTSTTYRLASYWNQSDAETVATQLVLYGAQIEDFDCFF